MKYFLSIAFFLICLWGGTQTVTDSAALPVPDSAAIRSSLRQDSLRRAAVQDSVTKIAVRDSLHQAAVTQFLRSADSSRYNRHPYFRFANPEKRIAPVRAWQGKEGLFYGIVAIVLFFGLLRNAFDRYLRDLFRTFFRTTMRQRLVKEQIANTPLPSLLFNLLFLLAGALLIALLFHHFNKGFQYPLWLLFLYCLAGLAVIYLTKFLLLKVFGWLLNAPEATNTYIFVVFTTNKVLGILLLPLILGLAFTAGNLYEVFFALSLALVGCLFVYRFYLSYLSVYKLVRINFFHFLVYIAAFEIAPLLLINKLLVQFFAQTP